MQPPWGGCGYSENRVTRVSDATPDLTSLARQQRQIRTGLGGLHDGMTVLTDVTLPQDTALRALLRAMHTPRWRLENRVSALRGQL